jgi:superfamily II DNA or RNA helicase
LRCNEVTLHTARWYQTQVMQGIDEAWASFKEALLAGRVATPSESVAQVVAAILPTGAGKSFVVANTIERHGLPACVIAHRAELVSQLSLALAREGVYHTIIGPASLRKRCVALHMELVGRSYFDARSSTSVASVDTLLRLPEDDPIFVQTRVWTIDEGHHLLFDNKWGKVARRFKNALGLVVTATPCRADGKGLGRHADGLIDRMIVGPSMRDLIGEGYLTEYRVFAPPNDLDLSQVTTTATGDYSPPKLSAARRKSHITGDVVQHYLRLARGKLGVTFDVDIESATETAAAFRAAGVPAEIVTGDTPDGLRYEIQRRFQRREILQLVNVDLFGEGYDLPAIEVVSMARPTQSYALFAQQFGRALRPLAGKDYAIIIDHVGNVFRHGLPDAPRVWSLDRRERRGRSSPSDVDPTRMCPQCTGVREGYSRTCPYCGHTAAPAGRSTPEQVEGDLLELDPAVLARLRGDISRIDGAPTFPANAGPAVVGAIKRNHWERQQAQQSLREAIALWAGWQRHLGRDDSESYRRFYRRYGVDAMTAQTLSVAEATTLSDRINEDLITANVKSTGVQQ